MQLNENQKLSDLIPTDGITIVDYYAEWCSPCKMVSPILDGIEKTKNITLIKVDIDKHKDICTDITSVPTLKFYKDAELIETKVGAMPKQKIEAIIASIK